MLEAGSTSITCVVGDDHGAVRAGLVRILGAPDDIEVVAEAGDGAAVLRSIRERRPDVAVVDARMPRGGGLDVCRQAAVEGLTTAIVVYTGYEDVAEVASALDLGARGYVLKHSPVEDLLRAVRAAANGQLFVDPRLVAPLLRHRAGGDADRGTLSRREREVLQLLAEGLTTEAAAARLRLSATTVRSYADAAMRKLDCRNRVAAVAQAVRLQLIE